MVPAKRKSDKHLPPNVYFRHGAYYYFYFVDKKRKAKRLGSSLSEAMKEWTKIMTKPKKIFTMGQLFDRYMIEVAPTKSPASFKQNQYQMQHLRLFFEDLSPNEVTPVGIYEYLDIRSQKSKVAPNREKALLSHVFSMAIKWGILAHNPCRVVKRLTERPRDRYVTDPEYIAVRSIASPLLQCLMDFSIISGQRISDILKIKLSDLTDEGIFIKQNKTNKKLIIEWSEHLHEVVQRIKTLNRKSLIGLYLFNNRRGQQLTYDSFKSIWQPTIKKALEKKLISEPFNFHDLRAKCASDAQDKDHISRLLGHTDSKITNRVYVRNAQKVKPFK